MPPSATGKPKPEGGDHGRVIDAQAGTVSLIPGSGRMGPLVRLMDRLNQPPRWRSTETAGARPLPIRRQLPTGEKRAEAFEEEGLTVEEVKRGIVDAAGTTTGRRASLSS